MRKKLILFLMLALFGSASFLRADEVTIGDPTSTTTNNYVPGYSLYNYALSQQIYTADEIGMSGTINDVTLWLKNSSSYARNYNIYMKEVSESTFADGNAWVSMTSADMVATGVLNNGISDPVATTFTLTTPFNYSGTGNLVICFQDVTGSWSSGAASVVMDATHQAIHHYRDASLYDPTTPGVAGTVIDFKSVVRLTIESSTPPTPPTPTGELVIAPNPFELGARPTNGWMEDYTVRINNGGAPVLISANISNTSGFEAFTLSEEIEEYVLATDEELVFNIVPSTTAAEGEYTEEFTLFSVETRDITTIPVTATIYTAVAPDIVEKAGSVSWSSNSFSATPDVAALHADYNLFGMTEKKTDLVYSFYLNNDYRITATGGDDFIAVYKRDEVNTNHLTAALEPFLMGTSGIIDDEVLLKGYYYLVVASENISDIQLDRVEIPSPTAITYVDPSPADGATEVSAPITLAWEGGENATEYQVLFGTSPVNMEVALDWTLVDENYGTFVVNSVDSNTQYFWMIKARNSKGTVEGPRWGFTTTLTKPNNVTASAEEIFTDESTLIKWKHSSGTMGDLDEIQIGSGTSTSPYLPTYNLYNYSLSEQIYTADELGGNAGYINSISFHPVGDITRNLKVYLMNTEKETFTGDNDWVAMTDENLVYEGNVSMVANTWVTITFAEPFEYEGNNLLLAVTDHTGTWTSSIQYSTFDATAQAINVYQDSAPYSAITPSGSGTVRNFKNQIIINKSGAKGMAQNRTFQYYNVYYGDVKANADPIYEKQYLLSNLPYNMEGHNVTVTAVYDEGESPLSNPVVVKVSGYGKFTGTVTELISGNPVAGVTVTFNGKDEYQNTVSFSGTTNASGQYTINNVKAGNYIGVATLDGMEPAYSESVTLAYNTTETVNFVIHEEYKPVLSVYATEIDSSMSKVQWSLNTVITGGGVGGSATTFEEGFESGLPADWSVVDGNNDGYTWCLTSAIPTTWTYYSSLTLDWYRTGTNAICSGSYINGAGALNPDEYLVMGQVNLNGSSTLSFWAAATDASYPADHFGVFVSDDATNWTSVQEWTLTGKDGAEQGFIESREGKGARLGTWHNFTVDLSAYTGQKYLAIRHFNCYDQYIMCVDDIELSAGSKGRDVQEYAVYRKAILKEAELVATDSVYFGTTTDTLYADFDWNNVEPGLYQYGVSAIYPSPAKGGNRDELTVCEGTTTNSYVPVYGFYADAYLKAEMVYPASMLSDMANGTISGMKFYATQASVAWGSANFQVFMTEVTDETLSAFVGPDAATMVYEGVLSIDGSEMLVEFTTPYNYNGGNLLVGVYNTATGSYVSSSWLGVEATGASIQGYSYSGLSSISPTQRNFLPKATFTYAAGGAAGNDNPVTEITWSNILPKNMETSLTVNAIVPGGSPEGATVILTNSFEDLAYNATFDETGTVVFEDFRKGNYVMTVDLEGFNSDYVDREVSIWDETTIDATLSEIFKPIDVLNISVTGFATWNPVVPIDRVPEKYFMQLDGIYYGETYDNQIQIEDLVEGQTYVFGVAVVYSTGMSTYFSKSFTYLGCGGVATQVEDLHVDEEASTDMNVALVWNGGTAPGPNPPTPPTPPTGNTFNFDDNTMMGWTSIDADGDGNGWVSSANPGIYHNSGVNLSGTGHNSSEAYVISGSYANQTGQALTPDNYLVSPTKGEYTGISFYACAQDANYAAEHFGVAVSTTTATASAFTMIQEWTLSAKDGGMVSTGRNGQTRAQGNWYEKTVDLSAYAGQEIWVAIRHFNCTDQFILNVDDVVLGTPEKGAYATAETCNEFTTPAPSRAMWDLVTTFNAAEGGQYGVVTDGEYFYTSNWGYSSAAHNFWKYDLDGNQIEGFEISGCGTLRGMTFDGEYVYGVANSSTIYCVDLNNHTLVGTTSSAYGAMRGITYDPQRDGFWVIGNWSGNLTLVDRTGAIQLTGPAPTSASDLAYYKDEDGNEHVYCFNNGTNDVDDYNITTGTFTAAVFNFSSTPGFDGGSSGGCHVANYGDKTCFIGDIQQSPNLIGIYELGEAQGGGGSVVVEGLTPNKFNIAIDDPFNVIAATNNNSILVEAPDYDPHTYYVFFVDSDYGISCIQEVTYEVHHTGINEGLVMSNIYPNPTSGNVRIEANDMVRISIVNALGQMVYNSAVEGNEATINMAQFGNGVYMVNITTANGTSVKRVIVSK